jgi:sterol desaturase/sphingolipid hydroxylase (fatty acid hydroxylase superfamily)
MLDDQLLDLEQRFNSFAVFFEWLDIFILFIAGLLVLEIIWDLISGQRSQWWETLANFGIFSGSVLLEYLGLGLFFVLGIYVFEPLALFNLYGLYNDQWWFWILLIIEADFIYYWMHRFEHEIRLLWAYHIVHHSSPEFNLTTSVRLSWVEGLIEWIFFVPLVLIGYGTIEIIIAVTVVTQYQSWIHTQKIGKLGILDKIVNTPSTHRVHHGSNAEYLDKNYGGILMIWDHLFGTYKAEEEPVIFGIVEPLGSHNPFVINFHYFAVIIKDIWRAKGWRRKAVALFGKPGARLDD